MSRWTYDPTIPTVTASNIIERRTSNSNGIVKRIKYMATNGPTSQLNTRKVSFTYDE